MAILSKNAKVLLLGCNQYSCSPLNWCVKDCERMTLSLIKNGIKNFNIRAFFDENVKHKPILQELTDFIKNNDEGLIYYSGHGTTDSKGNSCLVMYDSCWDERALIRTDYLYNLSKNKKFVFIFDCCYAHDATLGYELIGQINNSRHIALPNSKAVELRKKRKKRFITTNKSKSTFLFAATNDHVANEGIVEIENGRKLGGGFFTYSLINVLNQPLLKIHNTALNYLNQISPGQFPVFVSNNMNESLF